jgi:hypothetical protein
MSKRAGFRQQFNNDFYKDGNLTLPEDEEERKEAIRVLFGSELVDRVDSRIEDAQRILQVHAEFTDFTETQKAATLALISHTAYGALYSECVMMDQFSGAEIEIHLVERDEEYNPIRSTPFAGAREAELHHDYFNWCDRFGDYYDYYSGTRFAIPAKKEE